VAGILGDELECFDEEWSGKVVRVELFVVCCEGCNKSAGWLRKSRSWLTFQRAAHLLVRQPGSLSRLQAVPFSSLLLAQRALDSLNQSLFCRLRLIDILDVVQLPQLEVDLQHVLHDATAIAVVPVPVCEVIDPALAVGAHDLQDVRGEAVIAILFEEGGNAVLDAHDLVAKGIHAQLVGEGEGLTEVLVGLAHVEEVAAAVEESTAELLGDGFGEVVVGLDDDVAVVPRHVEDEDARHDGDAGGRQHTARTRQATWHRRNVEGCLRSKGEGKHKRASLELLLEGRTQRRGMAPRALGLRRLPLPWQECLASWKCANARRGAGDRAAQHGRAKGGGQRFTLTFLFLGYWLGLVAISRADDDVAHHRITAAPCLLDPFISTALLLVLPAVVLREGQANRACVAAMLWPW